MNAFAVHNQYFFKAAHFTFRYKRFKKFIYTALKPGDRAREYETALQWLDDAGMIHQVSRVSPPRLPLFSYQDFSAFKLYLHDVGLLGAMAGLSSRTLLEGNELFTNFRGSMTEQYVLQQILAHGVEPYYWTSDSGNAEVEFVVQGDLSVFPIEAKAGINTKAKSLKVYRNLFAPPFAISLAHLAETAPSFFSVLFFTPRHFLFAWFV